jgi:tripartite-type tricarboxylate transporter receptor subunit TctC
LRAVLILVLSLLASSAQAQEYPSKLIKLIVPFGPHGAADMTCRMLADRLMPILKQPIVVENIQGGNSMNGMRAAAGAAPDGYTLLFVTDATLVTVPLLEGKAGFDASSFAPITLTSSMPGMVVASPALPVRTLEELIARARASPGTIRYASNYGTSTFIGAELFKALTKTDIREVRVRSWAESEKLLQSGDADIAFATAILAHKAVREGRLKALAVMGHARLPEHPNVSHAQELGLSELRMYAWTGLVAPAGTPEAAIRKLNEAVRQVIEKEDTRVQFAKYGLAAEATPVEWFRDFIRAETEKWRKVLPAKPG